MPGYRAYPIRTSIGTAGAATLCTGSACHAEPGFRTAGVATWSSERRAGTSWNRAVWYFNATLSAVVRQGEPVGAWQVDIGQVCDTTSLYGSGFTPGSFQEYVSPAKRKETTCATWRPAVMPRRRGVETGVTYETALRARRVESEVARCVRPR